MVTGRPVARPVYLNALRRCRSEKFFLLGACAPCNWHAPPGSVFGVVDPFAGSCNALFWILRRLPGAEGLGFEFEQAIFDMSARNIASLGASIQLVHGDYRQLLGQHRFPEAQHIVAFLAPPWADALSAEAGLDLGRTKPPIENIVDDFERIYPNNPILYVTEVHERLVPEPIAALRARFEWSELNVYDIPGPTGRHGVLLGAMRWDASGGLAGR